MTGFTRVVSGETAITARGMLREVAERALGRLWIDQVPVRLASEDASLWSPDPAGAAGHGEEDRAPEDGRAVCWPGQPGPARAVLVRVGEMRAHALESGLTDVVLLGRGAPARAADVIVRHSAEAGPLTVLDGPDPGPLLRAAGDPDRLARTLIVITGDDPGTEALRRVLLGMLADAGLSPTEIARRCVTVAAPGTAPAKFAAEAGHTLIEAPAPTAFGALSPYALVPAALAGADTSALLDEAATVLPSLTRPEHNPGLILGAILGGAVRAGRGTVVLGGYTTGAEGLADWIAVLLNEAVQGRLLPVVQEGGLPLVPADDMFLVTLDGRPHQDDATVSGPLAAQLAVWEYAAAVAAYLLGLDPTAPPARAAAPTLDDGTGEPLFTDGEQGRAVEAHTADPALGEARGLAPLLDALAARVGPDEHLALVAYLDADAGDGQGARVRRLAALLAARCARPVTVSWGFRYPAFGNDLQEKGVYLMVTGGVDRDVPVPDRHHRLGMLQLAQALGDARAARGNGRPVVRLHLQNRWAGFARLLDRARGGA
ncbi:glucose-6-phosphate isomerase [Actinomadura litoris]|uniref:glucose-6-phosphate isomerase n=1 Tax=Actinomadura litoris TaxID=2678616 RepID=UPI001FA77BE6|nr:glucose-6-phosphate isomerase [Actinomadura litoris]